MTLVYSNSPLETRTDLRKQWNEKRDGPPMDEQKEIVPAVSVFYSYAHEDELLRDELEKHLSLLQRQGLISMWYDRQIVPGSDWSQEIDQHLNTASLILLLISPDFLASDYCYGIEMQRAMVRHESGKAYVIPILLRPVDWDGAPFAHLYSLPPDAKAVTSWPNRDEAFLAVVRGIRRTLEEVHSPAKKDQLPLARKMKSTQVPTTQERKHRERLLKHVRDFWIKGVLERSLYHTAPITLGLHEQPDALENPWHMVIQDVEQAPYPLPPSTHILQIYNEADGELLILGEPGAGKTTLLLELACALLDRTESDENYPIPVVLNLSSWAQKRLPLAVWLINELKIKYQVPLAIGQEWISTDRLLLLLDDLDEVAQAHRTACVTAINAYHREHSLVSLVVCSRRAEYLAQSRRVLLQKAVLVQPLTIQQIDDYLANGGKQLAEMRTLVQTDPGLQELATTPLMLSVLTLAYQGESLEDLATGSSPETLQRQIFKDYVKRMLRPHPRYSSQQTIRWLSWLAKQLTERNLTQFHIGLLSLNWLTDHRSRRIFYGASFIWIGICVGGLVGALIYGLRTGLIRGAFTFPAFLLVAFLALIIFFSALRSVIVEIVALQYEFFVRHREFFVRHIKRSMEKKALDPQFIEEFREKLSNDSMNIWLNRLLDQFTMFHMAGLRSFVIILRIVRILTIFLERLLEVKPTFLLWVLILLALPLLTIFIILLLAAYFITRLFDFQSIIKRWLFWHTGATPWKYKHFLDYAVEHTLLYKTGRSYMFPHRLLLDYFASLNDNPVLPKR